jgi:sterol 3beta-glucosyltransferase
MLSAVVHHGGFGATATLRAGVPGLVVPHIIDQFYWGQRVFELGAGPKFIARGQLKAQPLAAAMRQAVSNPRLREKAAELGRQIRAEPDGVTAAVRLIESAV